MSTQTLQEIETLLKQANNAFIDKDFKSAKTLATQAFAAADQICMARCQQSWPQARKLRLKASDLQDKAQKKIYFSSRKTKPIIVRLQDVMVIAPSSITESSAGIYAGNGASLGTRA